MPQIGLVLGAGGAIGHAFHAGVLAALADATGWDARDAELIVGTSAGSLVGAFLRAGLSGPDLAARATGAELSSAGRALADRIDAATRHLGPIPERSPGRRGVPKMSAPGALVRAAIPPWTASPGALAAAALPAGRVSTEVLAAGLRPLFDHWPDHALWINVVDLHASRRVTFGRDDVAETDVATAVAASCAIPTFFEPVLIDGVRYIDGGAHSPTNADLTAGLALDLVVVSSPMSVVRHSLRLSADQPARRVASVALAREVARVRRSGTPVITFQPTAADLVVMGDSAMDTTRVADVAHHIRMSARERLERVEVLERVEILSGRAA